MGKAFRNMSPLSCSTSRVWVAAWSRQTKLLLLSTKDICQRVLLSVERKACLIKTKSNCNLCFEVTGDSNESKGSTQTLHELHRIRQHSPSDQLVDI